jgi:hypothetical protein
MERDQLNELHFITLLEDLPSILERGILSHVLAEEVEHTSVAAAEIQDNVWPSMCGRACVARSGSTTSVLGVHQRPSTT